MTNYEQIKNMNVKQLAEFLDIMQCRCCSDNCESCPIHDVVDEPSLGCSEKDILSWLLKEEQK